MKKFNWWLGLGLLILGILTLTDARADTIIHDNAHLLSAQQRTQIEQTNQRWATTRHKPQLWVYTCELLVTKVTSFWEHCILTQHSRNVVQRLQLFTTLCFYYIILSPLSKVKKETI